VARTILVVDDEPTLRETLIEALEADGYRAVGAADGREALEVFRAERPDLVLLDLMLPELSGVEVCRIIRAESGVPIVMLTAKDSELDKVVGLELGADDYVVKPFGHRELVARIRAVLRRTGANAPAEPEPLVRVGELEVDRRSRKVTVGGLEVTLTRKEYDLLALLAEDPGAVRTREEILERVWDPHWYGPTKTLDVHVASLRRKLGDASLVETVRGVGFRLRASDG